MKLYKFSIQTGAKGFTFQNSSLFNIVRDTETKSSTKEPDFLMWQQVILVFITKTHALSPL